MARVRVRPDSSSSDSPAAPAPMKAWTGVYGFQFFCAVYYTLDKAYLAKYERLHCYLELRKPNGENFCFEAVRFKL